MLDIYKGLCLSQLVLLASALGQPVTRDLSHTLAPCPVSKGGESMSYIYIGVYAVYTDRAERKWLAGSTPMSAAACIHYMLAGLESCPGSSLQHLVVYIAHWTLVQFRRLDIGAVQPSKYL